MPHKLLSTVTALLIFSAIAATAAMRQEQAREPDARELRLVLLVTVDQFRFDCLEDRFGSGQWILGTAGTSPYLNHALMAERGVDQVEARQVAAAAARSIPQVARVYTREQLLQGSVPTDAMSRRILHSYHPRRSGDLEIVLNPFWIRQKTGTTHGTPYPYDSHIPLIFVGSGIRRGRYTQHVALNDVAPTLAVRLGISLPSSSDGRVLSELLASATDPAPATR
jgi:hypothetical protein